ncbi:hypothetical protein L204_105037 [Cryptococcus depauperatus]|nr:hypothetical protein L204_03683 [Cryptococcus depauperatus CBS 7855]
MSSQNLISTCYQTQVQLQFEMRFISAFSLLSAIAVVCAAPAPQETTGASITSSLTNSGAHHIPSDDAFGHLPHGGPFGSSTNMHRCVHSKASESKSGSGLSARPGAAFDGPSKTFRISLRPFTWTRPI